MYKNEVEILSASDYKNNTNNKRVIFSCIIGIIFILCFFIQILISMKVKELIAKLEKFNPNLDLVLYLDADNYLKTQSQLFEIENISVNNVVFSRNSDNKPILIFENSNRSEEAVIIKILSAS